MMLWYFEKSLCKDTGTLFILFTRGRGKERGVEGTKLRISPWKAFVNAV